MFTECRHKIVRTRKYRMDRYRVEPKVSWHSANRLGVCRKDKRTENAFDFPSSRMYKMPDVSGGSSGSKKKLHYAGAYEARRLRASRLTSIDCQEGAERRRCSRCR